MEIRYSRSAAKSLRRSGKRDLIRAKIEQLARDSDSLAGNIKRLTNEPESRLRVQDWRVLFRIDDGFLYIDAILPRGDAY